MTTSADKWDRVSRQLRDLPGMVVAFSGGVDSTCLLRLALDTAGRDRVLAATVAGDFHAPRMVAQARDLAQQLGARHVVVPVAAADIPGFAANPPDRCYWCKRHVFSALRHLAEREGLAAVVDGTHADDAPGARPGMRALEELGILSPLRAAGLAKAEIRAWARAAGLPNADQPGDTCLATRFPYGDRLEPAAMRQVAQAEDWLRGQGFDPVRVRVHRDVARIEVAPELIPRAAALAAAIAQALLEFGFPYVSLDLRGYRSGAMEEVIPCTKKN